jgi:ABC-type hemin transport system ATPase subunit
MDALELLVAHRGCIDDLFRCLSAVSGSTPAARRPLLDELIAALDQHLTVKEQFLYVRLPVDSALHVLSAARRKALELEAVLHDLSALDPRDARFADRVEALERRFSSAVEAEENVLFPSLCAHLDDATLARIGGEIARQLHGVELAA